MKLPLLRGPLMALAAAAMLMTTAAAHAAYVFTEVVRPGAATTALWDVNNSGLMVGYSLAGSGPTDFASAFIYDGSSFTSLSGPAGAISSAALGISDSGVVVGSFSSSTTTDAEGNVLLGPSTGFIYQAGSYTTLTVAGATETVLRGISPDGRYVTGYYGTDTVAGVGFVYDLLSAAFTTVSRPDSLFTIAQGVRNDGIVVGSDIIAGAPLTRPGFFYDVSTGTRTDAAIAGASRTALRSLADDGTLAGWFIDGAGQHGFVGSLADFEQIDFAGAIGTYVEGSNNAGTLVGGFITEDGRNGAFIASRVPEPGSAALLALGLFALAWTRRPRAARATR